MIADIPVKIYDQVKHLGLTLTSNLHWEPYIKSIRSKAEGKLNYVRRKLHNALVRIKLSAYKTLVRPTFEYADIWSPLKKYSTN